MAPVADLLASLGPYERPILFILAFSVAAVIYQTFFAIRYPRNLPRIGSPPGARGFTWRTYWKYYTDCQGLFRDAFENVRKLLRQ
jgi:hypothetical protein